MLSGESHLSDQELLLAADGELSERDAERVQSHLAACWACRARTQEMERVIGEFVHIHQGNSDVRIPPLDGPRSLLQARIAQLAQRAIASNSIEAYKKYFHTDQPLRRFR